MRQPSRVSRGIIGRFLRWPPSTRSSRFSTKRCCFRRIRIGQPGSRGDAETTPELMAEVSSLLAAHDAMATTTRTGPSHPGTGHSERAVWRLSAGASGGPGRYERGLSGGAGGRAVRQARGREGDGRASWPARISCGASRTEAQFLASLEHPNIPALLDGGVSPSGHPYLVVEYVEGETLDRYCGCTASWE